MVPRGEVGLIFAATGSAVGVLSSEMFSTIVLVVIITTFVSPALIKKYGQKLKSEDDVTNSKARIRAPHSEQKPKKMKKVTFRK
jgi:Kef-type K+ transport system membrane component KefB